MPSGVADYLNVLDSVVSEVVADPSRVWEPTELIDAGVSAGVQPPGTPGYSATNYIVLQLIAEQIGGSALQDLIEERLTAPLNLGDTLLPSNEDTTLPDPAAHGYIAGLCVAEVEAVGATIEDGTVPPTGTRRTDRAAVG